LKESSQRPYIGVVCVALAALALEILGSPDFNRLARRCAVTVVLALTGLVYWNHAGWIARANLDRYERTGMLDLPYVVASLGPDAVLEVIDYLPRLPIPIQIRMRSCLHNIYASAIDDQAVKHAWYQWSYRRSLLESTLRRENITAPPQADSQVQTRDSCYRS
jgi:hypothetical protein